MWVPMRQYTKWSVFFMKKQFLILVAGLVLAVALAACMAAGAPEAPSTDPSQTTTPSQNETTDATEGTGATKPEAESETKFEELTLVEDTNCTVKVTAVQAEKDGGFTIKVFLENKTDKELMYTVDDVSVNGFMCDPFWVSTVSAGKKSNEKISFSESDFKDNNIEKVESITFTLKVYNSDDMDAEDLVNKEFTVTP